MQNSDISSGELDANVSIGGAAGDYWQDIAIDCERGIRFIYTGVDQRLLVEIGFVLDEELGVRLCRGDGWGTT